MEVVDPKSNIATAVVSHVNDEPTRGGQECKQQLTSIVDNEEVEVSRLKVPNNAPPPPQICSNSDNNKHSTLNNKHHQSKKTHLLLSSPDEKKKTSEKRRRLKEERYIKRTLEATVSKMLDVLKTERGQKILDIEAHQVLKHRLEILNQLSDSSFVEDADLRNFVLVKLFQLYDIKRSAAISRSDFMGIVHNCMGLTLREEDIDNLFNTTVVADFDVVAEFVQRQLTDASSRKQRTLIQNVQKSLARNGARAIPSKEDYRIAQKMILERLKSETYRHAKLKFRNRRPVLCKLTHEELKEGLEGENGIVIPGLESNFHSLERGNSWRDLNEFNKTVIATPKEELLQESIIRAEWLLLQQEIKNKKGNFVKVSHLLNCIFAISVNIRNNWYKQLFKMLSYHSRYGTSDLSLHN